MFKNAFISGNRHDMSRPLSLLFSVVIHSGIVFFFLVFPLFDSGSLPEVEIFNVFLAPPPPPSPPPPPPPLPLPAKREAPLSRIKPIQTMVNIRPGRLIVPVEIPDEIIESETFAVGVDGGSDRGARTGVSGGSLGGAEGGVLGGVIGGVLGGIIGKVETPIRAGGEIKPPRLIKKVVPVYPEVARMAFIEGVVILEATTDVLGRVQQVRVLLSCDLLDQAAIDAVWKWVYEPMVINGNPRGVIFNVTVIFKLEKIKEV